MDLTRKPLLKSILQNRWLLFLPRAVTLAGYIFTILAGFLGTNVGGRNFAIIFVWIAWWTVLKLVLIPFGGRLWCSICPIPVPGEWVQQRFLVNPQGKPYRKRRRWPKKLRGSWLHLGGFALMGLFSAVLLTIPAATAGILLFLLLLAFGISLVYERRAFCLYLCPMGGYIGWYAQLAPVEVRARDRTICDAHKAKTCYTGSVDGPGCPWDLVPATNQQNLECGLCMECQHTCPYDNMAVRLRSFGKDLSVTGVKRSLDRTWFGLFMLACVPVYTAVMLGPWGFIKNAAYRIGSASWLIYAAIFLVITLAFIPGLFALSVYAGWQWSGKEKNLQETVIRLGYALAPLGLMAWIAFTISFAFAKLAYIWPVLSDPFGWGWNLLGTAHLPWRPYLQSITPLLQLIILGGGLVWSGFWVRRFGHAKQTLPVHIFSLIYTVIVLWLLL